MALRISLDISPYRCPPRSKSCNSDMMKKCNACVFSSTRKEIFPKRCTTDESDCMIACQPVSGGAPGGGPSGPYGPMGGGPPYMPPPYMEPYPPYIELPYNPPRYPPYIDPYPP